jgi:hypothetical protein
MANTTVGTKVENNGATSSGRLSATEINDITGAINSKSITAFVASTTALADVSGADDIKSVWVENVGLFQYSVIGPANGGNIFAAANSGGFWVLKRIAPRSASLSNIASIPVNAAFGDILKVTITGNRHFENPTNPLRNQRIILQISQGTGSVEGAGFSVTYASKYRFSKTYPEPLLSQGEGNTDYIEFMYNETSDTWDCIGYSIGYVTA